jgi:hypothetical protein
VPQRICSERLRSGSGIDLFCVGNSCLLQLEIDSVGYFQLNICSWWGAKLTGIIGGQNLFIVGLA